MKFKNTRKSRMVVELDAGESALPPVTLPELKLQKILVPVDFSEPSRKALQYAVSFARQFSAEILLLHIVDPTPMVVGDPMGGISSLGPPPREETAVKHLAKWREEVVPKALVRVSVRTGNPEAEIVRAADENNFDLIIIGRHGRTGFARLFLGSTAEYVLRHAPCPALVVREREHDFIVAGQSEQTASKPAKRSQRENKRAKTLETA